MIISSFRVNEGSMKALHKPKYLESSDLSCTKQAEYIIVIAEEYYSFIYIKYLTDIHSWPDKKYLFYLLLSCNYVTHQFSSFY